MNNIQKKTVANKRESFGIYSCKLTCSKMQHTWILITFVNKAHE